MEPFVLAAFGACLWGLAPIFAKLGLVSLDPITALGVRSLIAAALMTFSLLPNSRLTIALHMPASNWVLLGVEALLAAVVGDLAYYAALKAGGAGRTSLIMSAAPLITLWAAGTLLGEALTWPLWVGGLLIVAGLILIGLSPSD